MDLDFTLPDHLKLYNMPKKFTLLLLLVSLSVPSFSQNQNANINQSFANGDYRECIKLCDEILKKHTNDKDANFYKGAALVRLKKYKQAEAYLVKADKNDYQPKFAVNANLLRVYGGLQQTDILINLLQGLVDNGFRGLLVLQSEEFKYLETSEKFKQLKLKVDANANPCKYGDEFKRLDFWIGEWDVYVNDKKTGTSSITKSEGGCTLYEDYKTFSGFLGRSTNYYDPSDQLYTQIWIDKFNSITIYKETASKEGYLQMSTDQGNGTLGKMTYVLNPNDGSVTQTMESSSDNGSTWAISFVGVYKKKNNSAESQVGNEE